MSFSENLKAVRKQKGISQEELAARLDVSRQTISRWETGDYYPETEKLLLLATILEVSLDALMYGESKQPLRSATTGKILIRSMDKTSIVNCDKVKSNSIPFKTRKKQPKFVLYGVDGTSLFGDNNTVLGWYMTQEDIQKEIMQIEAAMKQGITHYELQYAADVKIGWFNLRLKN